MTVFVKREGEMVRVRLNTRTQDEHMTGESVLGPHETLFGKPIAEIADGIYTDDGAYIGSFADWFAKLKVEAAS